MDIIKRFIAITLPFFLFLPAYAQPNNQTEMGLVQNSKNTSTMNKYTLPQETPSEKERKEFLASLKKQGLSDKEIQRRQREYEG